MSNEAAIGAYRSKKDVYIPAGPLSLVFERYFHEAGHIISEELSYNSGDVLSPNEARQTTPLIRLFQHEFDIYSQLFLFSDSSPVSRSRIDILKYKVFDRILSEFVRGKFNPSEITLHYGMSQQELQEFVKERNSQSKIPTLSQRTDGGLEFSSASDLESLVELGPIYTSLMGQIMNTNYLNHGLRNFIGIPSDQLSIANSFSRTAYADSPNHKQAYIWALDALTKNNYVYSVLDINNAFKRKETFPDSNLSLS